MKTIKLTDRKLKDIETVLEYLLNSEIKNIFIETGCFERPTCPKEREHLMVVARA